MNPGHGAAGGPTLAALADALRRGTVTSRALVQDCLDRIADPAGEGARTYLRVNAREAFAVAEALDARRRAGAPLGPLAGIPLSIKDAFDVQGQVTTAGSWALQDALPAAQDAPAVARLRAGGAVLLGRTNMTEFAYSGLGLNPHHGTPRSPWRRDRGHAPGGSSSGAAVSVADGMAHGALGTDTGGSCRIPAAFCGLVGYKPSRDVQLMQGAVPLAPSVDTAGVVARSVACCRLLADVLGVPMGATAGEGLPAGDHFTLGVPQALVLDGLGSEVADSFERALSRLSAAGARLVELPLAAFGQVPAMNAKGGFPAAESFHWHRPLLAGKRALYDPRVLQRIERGAYQSAADYLDLLAARAHLIAQVDEALGACDALVFPTVAIAPPRLQDLEADEPHHAANVLCLRNTALVNLFDGCAVSLPMHRPGDAPAGLMLACGKGADGRLLALAARAEAALQGLGERAPAAVH